MKGWGLASAFRTLTILRVPGNECESPATTLYWFVPVGVVIGLLLVGIGKLGVHYELFQLTAVFIVIALAVITRAFHLDGLADTFDGFGGGWTKERRLEIMRDSTTGAFGVIALVLVLVGKVVAVSWILSHGVLSILFYVPLFSRFLVVGQTVWNTYARSGDGTAARLVRESRLRHVLVSTAWVVGAIACSPMVGWTLLGAILGSGVLTTLGVALVARRKIGGVTGDVLGATVELSELVMFCSTAVLLAVSV